MAAFGLRLTGSWWMSVPLLVAGTLAFMSLGLLAGALAKTQEGAVNLANFLVLPMAFLSGSFFPLDGSPQWLQVTSQLLPLRHLNDGMLDVMVRGDGPGAALLPIAILLAYHAICFGSPWRTGYDASVTFAHKHQQGFLGLTELRWDAFVGSFLKLDNGLLPLAPWLGIWRWSRSKGGSGLVLSA